MHSARVNETEIHFTENIIPGKKLVVFIHGAGGNTTHFPPNLKMSQDFSSIAIDLPGHGKSDGLAMNSIDAYVNFLHQFAVKKKLSKFYLAGHSMGGAIAQKFVLKYPELVSGLILLSTGPSFKVMPSILELTRNDENIKKVAQLISKIAYGKNANESLVKIGTKMIEKTPAHTLHCDFTACSFFDAAKELGEIKLPTLILCGEEDRMTPKKYSHLLSQGILNSKLILIENAGHMLMLENPEITAEHIKIFLEKN